MLKKVLTSKMIFKVTENEYAIQQELFDNIIEIGFENVMYQTKLEKLLLIFLAILLKLLSKNSNTVVKIIVSMSQKQHQQLMYILIFCREVDLLYHQNAL